MVKLSDAVQPLPRQTTAFVHGVPHSFIKVGEEKAQPAEGKLRFENGAYFIGKARTYKIALFPRVTVLSYLVNLATFFKLDINLGKPMTAYLDLTSNTSLLDGYVKHAVLTILDFETRDQARKIALRQLKES